MKSFSLKMCSLIMIVAMLFSFMALPTSAAVIEGTSIDFSMSLAKTDDLEDSDGEIASDYGNIYKLTIHMNANTGFSVFQYGITYDTTKFDLIADDSTGYFSFADGNSTVEETGYTDVANARLGCLADSGKYGKDGSEQTIAKNILYYGPALSNAKTTFTVQAVETDSESHLNYLDDAGYDSTTDNGTYGVMFVRYMCSNAIAKGVLMATGDEDVWEIYLKLKDGESPSGAEFRFSSPSASVGTNPDANYTQKIWFGKAITFSGTGATDGSESISASTAETPESLTTNNLVVAATPVTVAHLKDQIRFDMTSAGAYKNTFDYRVLATINLGDAAEADLKMAGFVFNVGAGATIDLTTAQADIAAKYADANATTTYSMTTKAYISTSTGLGDYVMACVVNDIPDAEKTNTIASVGYVVYEVDGVTNYAFFDAAEAVQFSNGTNGLYDTYYSQQFGA